MDTVVGGVSERLRNASATVPRMADGVSPPVVGASESCYEGDAKPDIHAIHMTVAELKWSHEDKS